MISYSFLNGSHMEVGVRQRTALKGMFLKTEQDLGLVQQEPGVPLPVP